MGRRTNTVLQTCFFALSGVLPPDEAVAQIKSAIAKTYGKKGEQIVKMNFAAVDAALAGLHEVAIPRGPGRGGGRDRPAVVRRGAGIRPEGDGPAPGGPGGPDAGQRDPGRRVLADRHVALREAQHRPRDARVGPGRVHPVQQVRARLPARRHPREVLRRRRRWPARRPGFVSTPFRSTEFPGQRYTLQVAPEDCTGCSLCVQVCPAKDRTQPAPQGDRHGAAAAAAGGRARQLGFLPGAARSRPRRGSTPRTVKGAQFMAPLFEFSGACAGCGETPYLKLLTQLFGDRLVIANATGCSSIYGGNLPTTPYCANTRRPRARLGQLALRGQRRVRPRAAARDGAARALGAGTCWRGFEPRLTTWAQGRAPRRRPEHRGRHRGAAGAASPPCARSCARWTGPTPAGSRRWPTTWSRSPCGSSGATAGPTTSATAASTTCSRAAPT